MAKHRTGHTERLPADFEQPRQPHQMSPSNDFAAGVAELSIPHLPPAERDARNAAAVRYLLRRDAGDLVDMLGLAGEGERRAKAPRRLDYQDAPCPRCHAALGMPCMSKSRTERMHVHTSRRQRVEEMREAAA